MLKFSKIYIFIIFILVSSPTFAQGIYFMDFTKVLNQSTAGKEAQNFLKNKLKNDNAKFKKISDGLRESEKKLIAKKKTISAEDYKKEINLLRSKVNKLQNDQRNSINKVAQLRKTGREKLLKALQPIMKKYMDEKKITVILDKKNVLLGLDTFDITDEIIALLNKEIKSINLK
tara:strand:- start:1785 stop:2306 length:522 start_codon:yes stop_codon:yes gene_type:complete